MRSFLSLRTAGPLHSLHARRCLTTLPKPIPTYIKAWDPTKHTPYTPQEPPQSNITARDAVEQDVRKIEREQLRDTQEVTVPWKEELDVSQHYAIKRLNKYLWLADSRERERANLSFPLWRAYFLAKDQVPGLPFMMPDRAWDIMWTTQATQTLVLQSRRAHLQELYLDMHSVRKSTTLGQRIAYLESVFLNGRAEKALKEWEEDYRDATSPRQDYKPEFLELGARLHAMAGKADHAREIMEELFGLYPTWDPSIMITVFRAHTETKSSQHHDMARAIYLKLKERLGDKATLKDHDACFVGFLEARHVRYAKQVFGDMIKDGHLNTSSTPEAIERVLERLHMLYRLGTDIEKMTSIALQALSVLPQAYYTHVFGGWMKSAVVQKAPEAATQILDMMFSRGYRPETIHFNLLLKALLRTRDGPRVLKAENIGWRMVEEARKISPKKLPDEPTADIISKTATGIVETESDDDAARKVPTANVTTFALLMQHHANNLQWEHVDYLVRHLKETGISPNVALMNVLMDKSCRQGRYSEAWKTYKSLADVPEGVPGVFPDGASIRCLWKTLRLALGDHATREDHGLPTPRELLAETVQWWMRCRSRLDAEQFRMGLAAADHGAITSLMMHCFSYTQDFAGSLVALHVIRNNFKIFPSDKAAATLQNQAAWVDMHRETQSVRSQYHRSKINKKNLDKLGRVYYILMERRFERMNLTGDQYAYLSDEEVGDLGLNLLSEFVRVVLKRSYPPEVVENMIQQAKEEVGVPGMATGDMDAFSVA